MSCEGAQGGGTRRGLLLVFTLLGVAVVLSLATVIAIYMLVGRGPSIPDRATLTLKIGGELSELDPTDVVSFLSTNRPPTVRSTVDLLRKAKSDKRIAAVFLQPTGFSTPYWGKIQEIREAVLDFKTSGKPVYAFLEYAGDRDYYLASAADKVFLMPSTPLDLKGVATLQLFLRGTLDLLGVFPDLHHIGDYKTAVNTFTEKGYTPAHKEMDVSLNGSLFDALVRGIAEGRKKTIDEVRGLVDKGPFLPDEALKAGLIDDIAYEDEALAMLHDDVGGDEDRDVETADYGRVSPRSLGLDRGPRIGVIYASGAITGGHSGFDPVNGAVVGSDTLVDYIRRARKDTSLKALILRVDSPGGSATASDVIWHELRRAKDEDPSRPLIASMSDLAASGGYYIAMAADAIVAQPSTLRVTLTPDPGLQQAVFLLTACTEHACLDGGDLVASAGWGWGGAAHRLPRGVRRWGRNCSAGGSDVAVWDQTATLTTRIRRPPSAGCTERERSNTTRDDPGAGSNDTRDCRTIRARLARHRHRSLRADLQRGAREAQRRRCRPIGARA